MSYIHVHALRDAHTRIYSCITYMQARIPIVDTYTNVYTRIRAQGAYSTTVLDADTQGSYVMILHTNMYVIHTCTT